MRVNNKNKGYLAFTIAFVMMIIVWQMPVVSVMTIKDWMRLGAIELFFQLGFHCWNLKERRCD